MSLHEAIIRLAAGLPGRLGVALSFPATGETVLYHADEVFPSASVIKVVILAEVYRRALVDGTLDLSERLVLGPESRVAGSGVLVHLSDGVTLTVEDAAKLMIVVSDNVATNMLLDLTGIEPVNALARDLGLEQTVLNRKIGFDQPGYFAVTTPADMMRFFTLLDRRELVSAAVAEAVLAVLKECAAETMIPRYLPINPYAEELGRPAPPVEIAHKTGSISGVRNDAGLVILRRPEREEARYIVSVFTADVRDDDLWTPENVATRAVAEVARLAYEAARAL
ncbi:MAG: serine hydrolase [Chloroflexota bacterium]